jgi:hypothetical protein
MKAQPTREEKEEEKNRSANALDQKEKKKRGPIMTT